MLNEFRRRLLDTVGFNDYVASFADPTREIAGIDTYTYAVDYTNTAAPITSALTRSTDVIMDSDSDFVCVSLAGAALVTGNSLLTRNAAILVQITDQSSGRTYFNTPTPMPMISGQGGFAFLLTSPRIIRPRTTMTVSYVAALAGASFDGFYFALNGGRIFYK